MRSAVLLSAVRTPIGRHGGELSHVRPDDLAAIAIAAAVERSGVEPGDIEVVYFGCANQAGEDNRNVARMSALLAGLPPSVPGATVNRLCGSGLNAINDGARAIAAGDADLLIAGGVESMSRAPLVMAKPREAFPRGDVTMADTTLGWRFVNPRMEALYGTHPLGETAELVAEKYQVTRAAQDAFALESQRRAVRAVGDGSFAAEIVPVAVPQKKGDPRQIATDEYPRADTTLDKLSALRPAFKKDGSVTAGNASGINDGAAALVVASGERAKAAGVLPLARIVSYATAGVDPMIMGMGPVPAVRLALDRAGLAADRVDLFELNEAFAAQSLAVVRELGLDPARVNVHGGAIALGHPIGASGARVLTTLVHALRARKLRYGVAALCIGGGMGIAMVIEVL